MHYTIGNAFNELILAQMPNPKGIKWLVRITAWATPYLWATPNNTRDTYNEWKQFRKAAESFFQPMAESSEKGRYVAIGSHGVTISATKIISRRSLCQVFWQKFYGLHAIYNHSKHRDCSSFQGGLQIPSSVSADLKSAETEHRNKWSYLPKMFIALARRFESSITSKACCCKNLSSSVSGSRVMPCGREWWFSSK